MALFGFHIVLTLIAASVFSKVSGHCSLCDFFIFKGLYYHLLEGSLLPKSANKNAQHSTKKRKSSASQKGASAEGQPTDERLIRIPLTSNALEGVPFFDSLIWTLNYSCFALVVFILSEIYNLLMVENEDLNASMIWMFCALVLQIHILLRISFEKVSATELFSERNTLVCAMGLFFLGSQLFNAFADEFLDIDFATGYTKFIDSLNSYVLERGFVPLFTESARSPLLFLVCLSLIYATILTSFFFPLLQYTSLYFDSLEECTPPVRALLHASFLAPAGAFLLFLRPVVDYILETQTVTYDQLKALRLLAIFITVLLRLCVAKKCLQTFLDRPLKQLLEYPQRQLKREERQRKVANFASYSCTAALQHFMPVVILLSLAVILKETADISLISLFPNVSTSKTKSDESGNRHAVIEMLLSKELHEPLWTLTLATFLCGHLVICLFGVVMRRTMRTAGT